MKSEKMKTPIAQREWIEIKGRKLHWMRFINMLDNGRLINSSTEYCHMIFPLQEITESYVYGADKMLKYQLEDAKKSGFDIPSDMDMLSIIYDFYNQIESKLNPDLSDVLEKATNLSEKDLIRMSEEKIAEQRRKEIVRKVIDGIPCDTVQEKIMFILSLQEKKKSTFYFTDEEQKKKECVAAELWCSILIHSLSHEYITYGQMLSLVEDDILTATDISNLLEFYGEKRDFEWYSEDYAGKSLSKNTDLKIEDILEMAEPLFKKILSL